MIHANIYQDKASGAKSQRVGLKNAMDFMQKGDCLIVWKLDRLGRSLPHLIQIVTDLKERGISFRSITETTMDTTTPQWVSTDNYKYRRIASLENHTFKKLLNHLKSYSIN